MTDRVDWLVLLPPSRGITTDGDGPPWRETHLADGPSGAVRRKVIAAARKVRSGDLAAMVGAASAVTEAREHLRDIHKAATTPAIERYQGVVYDHLDAATLSTAARRRADVNVGIVSAVFGLVRGGDPVPPYRLLMLADLPSLGKLHRVWREVVPDAVCDAVGEDGVVIDLLSSEYAAAVGPELRTARRVVSVDLVQPDGRRVSSYGGKQAKGWLARHLLERGAATPEALDDFPHGRLVDATDTSWTIEIGDGADA